MKKKTIPLSDYELIKTMFDRLMRLEQSRRTTAREAKTIHTIRTHWTADGQAFAMSPTQRDMLVAMVDAIEVRMKTPPYPPFH